MSNVLPPTPARQDPARPGDPVAGVRMILPRTIRRAALALALAGVAAFGAIVYSASHKPRTGLDEIPVITAEQMPIRERPLQEGGMEIANRDSTVYDSLDGQDSRPGIERLTPLPETPVDGPEAPAEMPEPRRPDGTPALTADEIRLMHEQRRSQMQRGDAGEQALQQLSVAANSLPQGAAMGQTSTIRVERVEPESSAPSSTPASSSPLPPSAAPDEVAAAATLPESVPVVDAPPLAQATPPTPAATPAITTASKEAPATPAEIKQAVRVRPAAGAGARMIQLGAVRTEDAARAEWARLQKKYPGQLGPLESSIERADLGARGIYWRIRGGPVSAEDGKKICEALKAGAQTCMVVSR